MKRRLVLLHAAGAMSLTAGCLWDRTNDGSITIVASEILCSDAPIDLNFDTRDSSQAVNQTLDEIVNVDEYTTTPPYDSATTKLYDILLGSSEGNDGTMKYDGKCYEFAIQRIFDD